MICVLLMSDLMTICHIIGSFIFIVHIRPAGLAERKWDHCSRSIQIRSATSRHSNACRRFLIAIGARTCYWRAVTWIQSRDGPFQDCDALGGDRAQSENDGFGVTSVLKSRRSLTMQTILLIVALALGALVTYVDTRPTWDDTGVTAAALLVMSGGLGSLAGGCVAAWIGRRTRAALALVLGGLLTLAGIANNLMAPPPLWFWIAGLIVLIPAAYVGARLAPRPTP